MGRGRKPKGELVVKEYDVDYKAFCLRFSKSQIEQIAMTNSTEMQLGPYIKWCVMMQVQRMIREGEVKNKDYGSI